MELVSQLVRISKFLYFDHRLIKNKNSITKLDLMSSSCERVEEVPVRVSPTEGGIRSHC